MRKNRDLLLFEYPSDIAFEYFLFPCSGYCLDAAEMLPAGSTVKDPLNSSSPNATAASWYSREFSGIAAEIITQEQWDRALLEAWYSGKEIPMYIVIQRCNAWPAIFARRLLRVSKGSQRGQSVRGFVLNSLPRLHKLLVKTKQDQIEAVLRALGKSSLDTIESSCMSLITARNKAKWAAKKLKAQKMAGTKWADGKSKFTRSAWNVCKK